MVAYKEEAGAVDELNDKLKKIGDIDPPEIDMDELMEKLGLVDVPMTVIPSFASVTGGLDKALGLAQISVKDATEEQEWQMIELTRQAEQEKVDLINAGIMTKLEAEGLYAERLVEIDEWMNEQVKENADAATEEEMARHAAKVETMKDQLGQMWDSATQLANMYFDAQQKQWDAEVTALKSSDSYKNASRSSQEAQEKALADRQRSAKIKAWKAEKTLNLVQIAMNTASAIMKIWAEVPKADFGVMTGILSVMAAGMGIAQAAIVASQKQPAFAAGGMVGGQSHAQGGTLIEAEKGEFVMNRGAVESIGIESMNRINEGGGGGVVNVNVSGNVMSQDFVEGELAELIRESSRRGTDFGIS